MAENNVVPAELMDPLSFWVSNIQAVDNNTIDMLRNLNFFLTYYDFASPVILIHDVEELLPISTKLRYIKGKFPVDITGRPLDPNLLSFWTAANSANAILRFILYYRIIEYAAFHFIDDKISS